MVGPFRELVLHAAALTAVLIAFGLNRRQYELTRHEQARAAALDERGRIARDLHDVLAHSLGALSVQLEVAEALLEERNDTAGALERVRRSRRLAVQGLIEARNAVAALRSSEVPALPEALAVLAEQHGQDHRVSVAVRTEGKPRPLESGVIVALLGAAREALTNAGKHAPADRSTYGWTIARECGCQCETPVLRNAGRTGSD